MKDDDLHKKAVADGYTVQRPHEPDPEVLASRFAYDAETGKLRRIAPPNIGPVVPHGNRYRGTFQIVTMRRDGKHPTRICGGRVAFALTYGRYPVGLRFRNRDRSDFRLSNLQEVASYAMAMKNRRKTVTRSQLEKSRQDNRGPVWLCQADMGYLQFQTPQHANAFIDRFTLGDLQGASSGEVMAKSDDLGLLQITKARPENFNVGFGFEFLPEA